MHTAFLFLNTEIDAVMVFTSSCPVQMRRHGWWRGPAVTSLGAVQDRRGEAARRLQPAAGVPQHQERRAGGRHDAPALPAPAQPSAGMPSCHAQRRLACEWHPYSAVCASAC